jgi:hypothetical protein
VKITIEPTKELTEMNGVKVRLWKGITETDIPVALGVYRLAVTDRSRTDEFDRELITTAAPDEDRQTPLPTALEAVMALSAVMPPNVTIPRNGYMQNVELRERTDDELISIAKRQTAAGWHWAYMLAKWIRDNTQRVGQTPKSSTCEASPIDTDDVKLAITHQNRLVTISLSTPAKTMETTPEGARAMAELPRTHADHAERANP